ncbi:hypothetical protein DdX_16917 [Ditylenchus destructor]|nr:hypothetical protein DdX_16917 [Ditylenchus destructor]
MVKSVRHALDYNQVEILPRHKTAAESLGSNRIHTEPPGAGLRQSSFQRRSNSQDSERRWHFAREPMDLTSTDSDGSTSNSCSCSFRALLVRQ